MAKVTIDVWQHVRTDCFVYYRFAGLCDGKPWCATIGIEIDGRDAEYEHHWGENLECYQNPDGWDGFLMALEEADGFYAHCNAETAAYYGEDNRQ
jgi:hypothetical protein